MIDRKWYSRRVAAAVALRVAASALLAGGLLACHVYRAVPVATVDRGSARQYAKLRVMTRDGKRVEIVRAFIRRDSVVGFAPAKDQVRRLAFARDQIVLVESDERGVGAMFKRAAMPRPGADDGPIAGSTMCPMAVNTVCVSQPEPEPTPK